MTYKVNVTSIDKISSPITVCFGGKTKDFKSGKELADFEFDKNYIIDEIYAVNEKIIVILKINEQINTTNWIGEEQVNFF